MLNKVNSALILKTVVNLNFFYYLFFKHSLVSLFRTDSSIFIKKEKYWNKFFLPNQTKINKKIWNNSLAVSSARKTSRFEKLNCRFTLNFLNILVTLGYNNKKIFFVTSSSLLAEQVLLNLWIYNDCNFNKSKVSSKLKWFGKDSSLIILEDYCVCVGVDKDNLKKILYLKNKNSIILGVTNSNKYKLFFDKSILVNITDPVNTYFYFFALTKMYLMGVNWSRKQKLQDYSQLLISFYKTNELLLKYSGR